MSVVGTWIADRRIYLDREGKAVEEADPTRVELLVPIGGSLPMARAQELGLIKGSELKNATELTNMERLTEALTEKDEEIRKLKSEINDLRASLPEATKAEEKDKDKAVPGPASDKAVKGPESDKAAAPSKDK